MEAADSHFQRLEGKPTGPYAEQRTADDMIRAMRPRKFTNALRAAQQNRLTAAKNHMIAADRTRIFSMSNLRSPFSN